MRLFNLIKMDNRDKQAIYKNANDSFDFSYSVQSGTDVNCKEPLFKDANKSIDTGVTFQMKEADYYA